MTSEEIGKANEEGAGLRGQKMAESRIEMHEASIVQANGMGYEDARAKHDKRLDLEAELLVRTGECQDAPKVYTAAENIVRPRGCTTLRSRLMLCAFRCSSLSCSIPARPIYFSSLCRISVLMGHLEDAWYKDVAKSRSLKPKTRVAETRA